MSQPKNSYSFQYPLVVRDGYAEGHIDYPYEKDSIVDIRWTVHLTKTSATLDNPIESEDALKVFVEDGELKFHTTPQFKAMLDAPKNKNKTFSFEIYIELNRLMPGAIPTTIDELVEVLTERSHTKLVHATVYSLFFFALAVAAVHNTNMLVRVGTTALSLTALFFTVNTLTKSIMINKTVNELKGLD